MILPLDLRKRRIRRCCETDLSGRSPESSCWSMRRASERSGTLRSFLDSQRAAVRLNCEGLTAVTYLCPPFYASGKQADSDVLRGCFYSAAGVRRVCGHQVVCAEFFQSSSHRAQTQRITVTSVCPGPVDTPFFDKAEKLHPWLSLRNHLWPRLRMWWKRPSGMQR